MKAKLLIVLVAISLALGTWWALSDDRDPEGPAQPADDTTEVVAERPAEPERAAPTLEPAPEPEPAASERSVVPTEERPLWVAGAGARELTGRVVLPPGTPDDEQLSVRLRIVSEAEGYDEGYVQLLEDASFTITAPPAEVAFELSLEGRYLYLEGPRRFEGDTEEPLLLEPRLGGWLSGRLVPHSGAPRLLWDQGVVRVGLDFDSGISAQAARGAEDLSRRLETDAEGRFEARAMPADRPFGLEGDVPGAPLALVGGLSLTPGEHRVLDVPLELGCAVRGTVRDEAGEPVAEADVRVVAGEDLDIQAQRRARTVETGADGTFALDGIPAGELRLTASADGYLPVQADPIPLGHGQVGDGLELVLTRGSRVAGIVLLPDGSPAEEAEVELTFDPAALNGLNAGNARLGADGEAVTGPDGTFEIQGLGQGPFLVRAQLTEEEGPWLFDQVTSVQPGDVELELTLREIPALTGVVQDAEGEPVTDFRLDLRAGSLGGLIAGNATQRRVTDPEGRFSVDGIQDGSWNLYVRSEGFGAAGPISADRPGPGDEPLVVTLERGVTLSGTVVDPAGRPVPSARVIWQADSRDMVLNIIKAGPTVETRTDEAGVFELTELPHGSLVIEASADHWAPAEPYLLEAGAGELVEDVELRLREGGTITGLFLDPEGQPMPRALVQVQHPGGQGQTTVQTDKDGAFEVAHLEPGEWQVIGVRPAAEGEVTTDQLDMLDRLEMELVELADGQTVEVTLGSLPENPVHVVGSVEPRGELAGGMAIFIPEGEDLLGSMKMTRIEDDGTFELDLEAPGSYVITLQSTPEGGIGQDNVEYLEEIPEVEQHRVTLVLPQGAVAGRVTGSDGQPLVGERVSLYADGSASTGTMSGGKYAEATTDDDGNYRIGHLEPGTYTVGAGGRPLTALFGEEDGRGRQVRSGVRVDEGVQVDHVDFELQVAGSIAGRITDSSGTPVSGASIFVRDDQGRLLERISLQTSGPDGSYDYRGLAPGDYTVAARNPGEATGEELSARVRSGETSELDLVLEPATMVEVIVTDADGNPMVAGIQILDDADRDVAGQFGMADLTGMLSEGFSTTTRRFGPLPPGKYRVLATSGELSASKLMRLKGQETRTVRIRLK